MRHYEIVILVHPDQSEQVDAMVERYRNMIENGGGQIHRLEDWGRRQLAFPINKVHKAHYVLMNIEAGAETLTELTNAFRFNDAVIRNLVMLKREAITEPSLLAKSGEDSDEAEYSSRSERSDTPSAAVDEKIAQPEATPENAATLEPAAEQDTTQSEVAPEVIEDTAETPAEQSEAAKSGEPSEIEDTTETAKANAKVSGD